MNERHHAQKLRMRYAKTFNIHESLVEVKELPDDIIVFGTDFGGNRRQDLPEWSLGYNC